MHVGVDGRGKPSTNHGSPVPAPGEIAPRPFRQFLLKIHSRCNLACDYCYVYEHADQGWRHQPRVMSTKTIDDATARIAQHAERHALPDTHVIMHGGEPLLAGKEHIAYVATRLRGALPAATRLHLSLQTNGVLLDEAFLDVLDDHGIRVGVSLDGARQAHDRHRRYADGRGAYTRVRRALEVLASQRYRHLFGGLLCTIDLANDPIETYEALLEFEPPAINLLLPHATWATPPPGYAPGTGQTRYGDWLVAVFDRWYSAPHRETGVRLFEELINLLLGGRSGSEAVGLTPTDLVVIETDGSLEQADSLKVAYEGAGAIGLNVVDHPFDAALALPAILARQRGIAGLCDDCQRCPLVRVCGGGHYSHRYRPDTGFANPSIYCADLTRLIEHMRQRVYADVHDLLRRTS
jgi:uncharacterized protein